MKYTRDELKAILVPMIESLGTMSADSLANAIIELIEQDRETSRITYPTLLMVNERPDHNRYIEVHKPGFYVYHWEAVEVDDDTL